MNIRQQYPTSSKNYFSLQIHYRNECRGLYHLTYVHIGIVAVSKYKWPCTKNETFQKEVLFRLDLRNFYNNNIVKT